MKLILDFDDVIFNAQTFKDLMFFFLKERGIQHGEDVYREMRKSDQLFSVAKYIERLHIPESDKEEVYEGIMTPAEWLVKEEMLSVFDFVEKENVFIVSQGDEGFQRDKIERALGDRVPQSHVVIVPGTKKHEIQHICELYKDEEVVFVDDKTLFLDDLPLQDIPNLTAILFDEYGSVTLKKALQEAKDREEIPVEQRVSKV
jgi:hypothetical protein